MSLQRPQWHSNVSPREINYRNESEANLGEIPLRVSWPRQRRKIDGLRSRFHWVAELRLRLFDAHNLILQSLL